ncbi:response regulator transcription factor [Streptomyces sp. ITFR-6]|uniref:response regulator n=1 Tax=Streptomyces sp. ITFR-6 TaxID=3075197 RepID=UPI002889DB1D|nr:response regulator transcription factor [Streptomyces sp. ITFR-6]WNI29677.1 response regulator transcription factor [Streptomyces sp. ITFR-6]
MSLNVLVVDDQGIVRAGFAAVIDAEEDMTVVGEAADGAAAVRLAEELAPDVVVMDVRMPELDGIAATRIITGRENAPRVLVLTTFDLDAYVFDALRAGASGFLLKDVLPARLLQGIREVAAGESVLAPSARYPPLTTEAQRRSPSPCPVPAPVPAPIPVPADPSHVGLVYLGACAVLLVWALVVTAVDSSGESMAGVIPVLATAPAASCSSCCRTAPSCSSPPSL